MRKGTFLLLLMLLAPSAHGMVYSWIDSAGVAHYTNKEHEIPVRYRMKVKARYPEQGDTGIYSQNKQQPEIKTEAQQPTPLPNVPVSSQSSPPAAIQTLQDAQPSASVKRMRAKRNRYSEE